MQSIKILLGLVASAAAIDVRLHLGNNCNGITYVWSNRNPGDCTQNGETWTSASFIYIPTNWNIRGQVHSSIACGSNTLIRSATSNQQAQQLCFSGDSGNPRIRGAVYYFQGKKRDANVVEGTGECNKGPDFLILEDGTSFNVTGVEGAALTEMTNLAKTGTISESLEQLRQV